MLKETFIDLAKKYSTDEELIYGLWEEIALPYSNKKRHYHTLSHLDHLLLQLLEVKELISDWDTVLFTLFYHDVVYNAKKSDNEEQSALLAAKSMKKLNVSDELIEKCKDQIMATKTHILSPDPDTNYFTDADLSILGQEREIYQTYAKNVRKEYAVYPDFIYNPGRKKVLQHFLKMERIYKTDYFYEKLEVRAKANLLKEITEI